MPRTSWANPSAPMPRYTSAICINCQRIMAGGPPGREVGFPMCQICGIATEPVPSQFSGRDIMEEPMLRPFTLLALFSLSIQAATPVPVGFDTDMGNDV